MRHRLRGFAIVLAAAVVGACAGTAARERAGSGDRAGRGYVPADVRFMQDMLVHHAQALAMTDLVGERSRSDSIRRLARRIEVSQRDEIAIVERWLERRGETVPRGHDHGELMPGMLTEGELSRLAAATGEEFDRLFLEFMIRHHEGALVMVADLFATGGGEEAEVFQFASHVGADQRAEIARMREVLSTLSREGNE